MAKKSASRRGRWQYIRRSRELPQYRLFGGWFACAACHTSTTVWMSVTQLPFDTAHVFDGSVDTINEEMAEASVDKIFGLIIELTNLPSCTLDRVILAGDRVHKSVRSERDGIVRGVLADADVDVIRKYRAQLVAQVRADSLCFWNIALVERSVAQRPGT
eukprot:5253062-Pleurochrysis_carterae.AAC.1